MIVSVKVKPGSKVNQLMQDAQGNFVLRVKAPPVDGKANDAVVEFFSGLLRIPKASVEIAGGHTNQHKRIRIEADETMVHEKMKQAVA